MMTSQPTTQLCVWYDGDCPVCRQEVALYSRIDKQQQIAWIDIVALANSELPSDKSRADLLGKFHAREHNGPWNIGVDAIAAIWDQLPVLSRLAFLFRTTGTRQLAELFYRGFLKWQRRHRARRNHQHGVV